jgi:tetratricopeptide (TPR) repeat protein
MAEDTRFQDAVDALRRKDRKRAKELLTEVIKSDQNNVTYWIWLSAAVDTTKERIYCLQTVLQLDPENTTAKRGLVLLGGLPPDENTRPFRLDRPRTWEDQLELDSDKSEKKGLRAITGSPVVRLATLGVLSLGLTGLVVFGLVLPRRNVFAPATYTPGPSPTFTLTPTFVNATGQAPPPGATLVPLAELLPVPHTPTPFYVSTPRDPLAGDLARRVRLAYESGDWDAVISSMKEIAKLEPESADPYYFIGEAYRFKGDFRKALEAYNQSLKINSQFGPGYLGLARARLMQDQNADITLLLSEAIKRDPNFGEVYLERAMYYLDRKQPDLALADLETAEKLMEGSPLVYYHTARAYLALEKLEEAKQAAEDAKEADPTLLPVYYLLGEIYLAQGNSIEAIIALDTYTNYETRDAAAFSLLGQVYYQIEEYELAREALNRALSLDTSLRAAYLYRGLSLVELDEAEAAEQDLKRASQFYKEDFSYNLGLMRAYILQEHYGDAYLQGERVQAYAETDEEKALAYYWRALNFEYREELDNAADAWEALLELPKAAVTASMRKTAEDHLYDIRTPTPSATPKATKSPTPRPRTPAPTKTPRS